MLARKKGVEMPVNILVLVAIAVLVLLGLIALTSAGLMGANPLAEWAAISSACDKLRSPPGCGAKSPAGIVIGWDANEDGKIDNSDVLSDYCRDIKGFGDGGDDFARCKIGLCGCTSISKQPLLSGEPCLLGIDTCESGYTCLTETSSATGRSCQLGGGGSVVATTTAPPTTSPAPGTE